MCSPGERLVFSVDSQGGGLGLVGSGASQNPFHLYPYVSSSPGSNSVEPKSPRLSFPWVKSPHAKWFCMFSFTKKGFSPKLKTNCFSGWSVSLASTTRPADEPTCQVHAPVILSPTGFQTPQAGGAASRLGGGGRPLGALTHRHLPAAPPS